MAIKFHQDMERYLAIRKRQQFLKNISSAAWSRVAVASHHARNTFSHYAGALKSTFRKKRLMALEGIPALEGHNNTLEKVLEQKEKDLPLEAGRAGVKQPAGMIAGENAAAASRPKKTFGSLMKALSGFISIQAVAEVEEEKHKIQEEQAMKDYFDVQQMMDGQPSESPVSNMPAAAGSGPAVENVAQLFPKSVSAKIAGAREESDEVIELDKGYKIRVVQNR